MAAKVGCLHRLARHLHNKKETVSAPSGYIEITQIRHFLSVFMGTASVEKSL